MHPTPLHFLLPFGLPAADVDLADKATFAQSAFAQLLRRATLIEHHHGTAFQRVLPHESWLVRCFDIQPQSAEIEQAPFAPYMLLAENLSTNHLKGRDSRAGGARHPHVLKYTPAPALRPPPTGALLDNLWTGSEGGVPDTALWACVEPVHFQLAHDHLVLANPAALALTHDEALSLLEAAKPSFDAFNLSLAAPTPYRWYLSGEALGEWLSTAPLRASGRNIEIWLPADKTPAQASTPRTRAWLKLQNEVQMIWFDHPVNRVREAQGQATVNSIWLYAQGALQPVARPFTRIFSNAAATRGLGLAAQAQVASVPPNFAELKSATKLATVELKDRAAWPSTLVELDNFTQAFIQQDASAQREAFATLENDWFAPALQALKDGTLPSLALILCGETERITLRVTRADLRKFWRRRTLASLLPLVN